MPTPPSWNELIVGTNKRQYWGSNIQSTCNLDHLALSKESKDDHGFITNDKNFSLDQCLAVCEGVGVCDCVYGCVCVWVCFCVFVWVSVLCVRVFISQVERITLIAKTWVPALCHLFTPMSFRMDGLLDPKSFHHDGTTELSKDHATTLTTTTTFAELSFKILSYSTTWLTT